MEDNKDLNVEITETVKEEEIVETVEATENKEDENTNVENDESVNDNDVNDKNLDMTADEPSTPPLEDDVTDTTTSQVVNEFVDDEKSLSSIVAEQTEQLEAIKKENEGLKEENKTLSDKLKELEKDIASLRENPFYKSGRGSGDLKMTNTNEYSIEDVERMRKRI